MLSAQSLQTCDDRSSSGDTVVVVDGGISGNSVAASGGDDISIVGGNGSGTAILLPTGIGDGQVVVMWTSTTDEGTAATDVESDPLVVPAGDADAIVPPEAAADRPHTFLS